VPVTPKRPAADLRGALASLVAGGELPSYVREHIGASWQRSLQSGLTPDRLEVPFDPNVNRDGLLAQAARPVLHQLAADLAGSSVAVLLTNERGQVVDRRVNEPRLVALLDRILLAPGYVYAEETVGTNGIGTALTQRRPSTVEGEEHFTEALTGLACAGAPITDSRSGRILGVIDLTCLAGERSALMLPFAIGVAREIEQRLIDDARLSERLVIQRLLRERRRARGPLVFITPQNMITNSAADRLVESQDEAILREIANRRCGADHRDVEGLLLSSGTEVSARVEPIMDSGFLAGTILRLSPAGARSRAERRYATFGWASLTATERSVIDLVAQGLTNREAGERLFLSHHTVGFHLRSIYRKLEVTSRVDLTRLVLEQETLEDRVSQGP
jgi:transcriptional regulator of acetoin/glycerol metabolism/DNA-binding CsgD family transcriptional regulator